MQIKLTATALLGASAVTGFRPPMIPAPIPVPVPGRLPNAPQENVTPRYQPRSIQPIKTDKRSLTPKPTLQDLLPTKMGGGVHKGLQAYDQTFPALAAHFTPDTEDNTALHDALALFWLKELDCVFKPEATLSEQRQSLDQHLMKCVGQNLRPSQGAFHSDNLKGKALSQSIEYLRLATVALRHLFESESDPGLEQYRRQYNPKDGTTVSEPEITLSPKIERYLNDKNINPVKVAIAIENVLETRLCRLKSRSQLMESTASEKKGFIWP